MEIIIKKTILSKPTDPIIYQSITEIDKKQIIEMSMRNNFFINEIFYCIYGKIYPPLAKKHNYKKLGLKSITKIDEKLTKIYDNNITEIITAKHNNEIIGFLICHIIAESEDIELSFLLVKQEYRNRGIAKHMIDRVKDTRDELGELRREKAERSGATPLDKCKSLLPVTIIVNCDKQLIKFYEKQGFKEMIEGKQYTKLAYPESCVDIAMSMLSAINTKNDFSSL